MRLMLKDTPLMEIEDDGRCVVLKQELLPFALRKGNVSYADFVEWASNRTLSIGRSYAKEILNTLRLSQSNRYAVCKACRGLSLEDSYWLLQDGDRSTWKDVNLFENPLSLFVTEVSLSGRNVNYPAKTGGNQKTRTPELTTLGASAKGWIRGAEGLALHKVGKYEIPASMIFDALGIEHIVYQVSTDEEIASYLTPERKIWIDAVGEAVVNAKLFTSEEIALVTFEEFRSFCENHGWNPYERAMGIDREFYLKMQIGDYILNNNDRHEQNWGFFMRNDTGEIVGYCPLFDHDHTFLEYEGVMSQTAEQEMTLFEAALEAQRELHMPVDPLYSMEKPAYLTDAQWEQVLKRAEKLK